MCTAVSYKTHDFYFGRTLDYEFSYGDEITVAPRNFPFRFAQQPEMRSHYAIIGMAHVLGGYPLYYEGANEKGLCIAGLNFVGNAHYRPRAEGRDNIAQYELIPWLLGQCASVREARPLLERMNLLDRPFRPDLPLAQLHWMIADRQECITVEAMRDGLKIYENPVGVMTNNPPFDIQLFNLSNYMNLSPLPAENRFCDRIALDRYSRGMGALGLPGDSSSQSRFVRTAFVKLNSRSGEGEEESVNQFFHILSAAEVQRGVCVLEDGRCNLTLYSCCINADRGVYYYNSYASHRIRAVDLFRENLDGAALQRYPLLTGEEIAYQN